MALEHYILKNSGTEVVVKVYTNDANGGTHDMSLADFAENGETITNLVFKELRNHGYIDKISNYTKSEKDKELSL